MNADVKNNDDVIFPNCFKELENFSKHYFWDKGEKCERGIGRRCNDCYIPI